MKLFLFTILFSVGALAQPGDKIDCQAEARAMAKAIFQVQSKRTDVDAYMEPNSWGSSSAGEAGEQLWFEFNAITVDKHGNKTGDLGLSPSRLEFVESGSSCVLTGYSLTNAG